MRVGLLTVTLVAVGLYLLGHRSSDIEAEQYAVYSAYLSSEIRENAHDYGSGSGDFIVLIQEKTTTPWAGLPRLRRLKADIPNLSDFTLANCIVRNATAESLTRDLRLPVQYELLPESDLQNFESLQKRFPLHFGYVTLSRVGFNRDFSQALFYTDHFCGLCGGGGYVLMEKTLGRWQMKAFLSAWVS
jgi:hypothetical protein